MQALLGLVYPRVAAGLGAAWALGRIVYTLGCVGAPGLGERRRLGPLA